MFAMNRMDHLTSVTADWDTKENSIKHVSSVLLSSLPGRQLELRTNKFYAAEKPTKKLDQLTKKTFFCFPTSFYASFGYNTYSIVV